MKRSCMVVLLVGVMTLVLSGAGFTKKVTLKYWDDRSVSINEWKKEAIEKWNTEHPDIKIDYLPLPGVAVDPYLKMGASLGVGKGPDIGTSHIRWSDDWAFDGFLAPIPEYVLSKADIEKNFPDWAVKYYQWDVEAGSGVVGTGKGEYYLLPLGCQMAVLGVNVDLVEEAGIDMTQLENNLTWDGFISTAEKLTKRTTDGRLIQAGFNYERHGWIWWQQMVYQQGGKMFKPGPTKTGYVSNADSPESLKALQLLWDIVFEHKLFDPGFFDWIEGFGLQKNATVAGWGWMDMYMRDNYPEVNFRGVVIPTFTGRPPYCRQYPAERFIVPSQKGNSKYEEHKEAIWTFYKEFLMSDEVIDMTNFLYGCIPLYKPILDNPERMAKYYAKSVFATELKQLPYTIFAGDEINEEFSEAIRLEERMLLDQVPPSEVIKEYIEGTNKALDERRRWLTSDA